MSDDPILCKYFTQQTLISSLCDFVLVMKVEHLTNKTYESNIFDVLLCSTQPCAMSDYGLHLHKRTFSDIVLSKKNISQVCTLIVFEKFKISFLGGAREYRMI